MKNKIMTPKIFGGGYYKTITEGRHGAGIVRSAGLPGPNSQEGGLRRFDSSDLTDWRDE